MTSPCERRRLRGGTRCAAPATALPLVLVALAGCRDAEPAPAATEERPAAEGPAAAADSALRFTDVTAASGITLANVSGDVATKLAIPENIGQGAAVLDFDGDGRFDVYVANGNVLPGKEDGRPTRGALYRNLGGMQFEDVTAQAGLDFEDWAHGASAVDFDADGHTDLYVTVFGGPNRFFRNRGDGTFADAAETFGGGDVGPSTGAAFFDADGDGDLDLYVGNYVVYDPEDPPNGGEPCEWKGLAVSCGPRGTTPAADRFYENRDGRLVEATVAFGFAAVEPTYTLGIVTADFDGDGDEDVYVANDSTANYLFLREDGKYREAGFDLGVDRSEDGRVQAGMGVDCGDVDNDLSLDLFVTNFSHDANALYHGFQTPSGQKTYDEAAYPMRLGRSSYAYLSWGTRFVDLDHDGLQDLVVVSGHVYPQVEGTELGTSYKQRNQVFLNEGTGEQAAAGFREYEPPPGDAFRKLAVSRGLAMADFDDDGDQDFLVVELDEPPTLIRTDLTSDRHWLGVHLVGKGGNRDAIGARVVVKDSRGVERMRLRSGGGSYLSTGDPRLHFGLGEAGGTATVTVRWPSGQVREVADLAVDRYHVVTEE